MRNKVRHGCDTEGEDAGKSAEFCDRIAATDLAAGRDLDALVAEKVMGWVWLRHSVRVQGLPKSSNKWKMEWQRSLFTPCHEVRPFDTPDGTQNVPALGHEEICVMNSPAWSKDMAAAWEVVEKMRETRHAAFVLGANGHANQFSAWFNDGVWTLAKQQNSCPDAASAKCLGSATSDTAPRAICLAALKACEASA